MLVTPSSFPSSSSFIIPSISNCYELVSSYIGHTGITISRNWLDPCPDEAYIPVMGGVIA